MGWIGLGQKNVETHVQLWTNAVYTTPSSLHKMTVFNELNKSIGSGVNAAGDIGDMSPATFGLPGIQYLWVPGRSSAFRHIYLPNRAAFSIPAFSMIHDIITDQRLDLLVVTETWMKASHPAAITHRIAPAGYRVLHRHRDNDDDGGGVAFVYSDQLQVSTVPLSSTVTGVDCLVSRLSTRRGRRRLNVAVVYRPPSSSKHGVCVTQSCSEFSELLDEMLALPGQLSSAAISTVLQLGEMLQSTVDYSNCWSHAALCNESTNQRTNAPRRQHTGSADRQRLPRKH